MRIHPTLASSLVIFIGCSLGIFLKNVDAQEKVAKGIATATVAVNPQADVGDSASFNQWIDQDIAEIVAIDSAIEAARSQWQVPGLAVAVVKDGRLLLSKGYGVKTVGQSDPVDRHTLFAIASNSKAFTAAALAILVDEGKIKWDDKVRNFLPWLELQDPVATQDLRIRDLLCHRSSLGTFSGDLLWYGTGYSPEEILRRAKHLPTEGPFRAHFGYSNLMFLAAGEVVRVVSGQSWHDFVAQRILKPLEMHRSVVSVRDLVSQGNYATPHKSYLDRSEPIAWMNWDSMGAAGGVISSADDMSRWLMVQLSKGALPENKRLFSETSALEMWESQMALRVSPRYSQRFPTTHFRAYGLGWSLADYKGCKLISHGGAYDGMYSQTMLIPEKQIGIVVLTNSMTGISDAITYHIVDTFLGGESRPWFDEGLEQFKKSRTAFRERIDRAIQPVVENALPSHPLKDYTGRFSCPMYGDAEVVLENDKLILKLLPNPDMVADLSPLHYDTFVVRWRKQFAWFDDGTAHFVANAKGELPRLELDIPNDDLWFYELQLKRVSAPAGGN